MEKPNELGLGGAAPDSSPYRDFLGAVDIEDFLGIVKTAEGRHPQIERLADYRSRQFVVTAVFTFNRIARTKRLSSIEVKPL